MSWGVERRRRRELALPRSTRRVPQPRVEMHRPGNGMGKTREDQSHSPTRCARARHALNTPAKAEGPAGAQRRSQTWGWWAPAGQDTVETLKQAYFQGYPESAGCVQGSIDSRNSAIHSAYRISLRPSSLFEPRHPSLKVVILNKRFRHTEELGRRDTCRQVWERWPRLRADLPATRRTQEAVDAIASQLRPSQS